MSSETVKCDQINRTISYDFWGAYSLFVARVASFAPEHYQFSTPNRCLTPSNSFEEEKADLPF